MSGPDPARDAEAAARAVVERGGPAVRAIVFFGSRRSRAAPDAFSAYDVVVVVDEYGPFYRRLARSGVLARCWRLDPVRRRPPPPRRVSPNPARACRRRL